jgi:hypothetical protein
MPAAPPETVSIATLALFRPTRQVAPACAATPASLGGLRRSSGLDDRDEFIRDTRLDQPAIGYALHRILSLAGKTHQG